MKKYFLIALSVFSFVNAISQQQSRNLIIGTYTNNCESGGIYVYDFDLGTASFKPKFNTEKVVNPSFLTVSADNRHIYSVNEDGANSKVTAFSFDAPSGGLKAINIVDSKGADPCYIINDANNVLVANYSGGSIAVFGKNDDGSLTDVKQLIQHKGKSKNLKRQESAHVHMVQFTPDKKFVIANDLGTDKIYTYSYNARGGEKTLVIKDSLAVKRGSGPRHLTFSADGKFAYLLQELDATLTVFRYESGSFKILQEQQVVINGFTGKVGAADIHITPDGKFLYATNRGTANDITCFRIAPDGSLKFKGNYSTKGKTPRNFAIDPNGNFLLVANQETNEVVIFSINKATGELTDTEKRIDVCAPVCLVFTE
ncbi:MAG: lactonase family protein [Flavobacterium sp.]|nr:lactonase family protein [Flavobacterium sp.]